MADLKEKGPTTRRRITWRAPAIGLTNAKLYAFDWPSGSCYQRGSILCVSRSQLGRAR